MEAERVGPLAHLSPDGRRHLLEDHLCKVSDLAAACAAAFDGAEHARLAGLWHDLGKYSSAFQQMLAEANKPSEAHVDDAVERGARGRVDHSTAGAFHACSASGADGFPIAFAIAGHHAGLADWRKLAERLKSRGSECLKAAESGGPPEWLLRQAVPPLPARVLPSSFDDAPRTRALELFTRMVFSALCDADFLDTEAFFDPERASLRGGHLSLAQLSVRLTEYVDALAAAAPDTPVNRIRAEVRRACMEKAAHDRGVFTLTVPTGGGKTLAAMEFALRHAERHGLRRVIVAIPYTSILEQSAAVYRRAFGLSDDDPNLLEHHSAMDQARETARGRLAAENWDVPVIVTTNVQLLESLFARRTSRCRKLHNLARSVIILDEPQTLPRGFLAPTTDVLDALVRDYGASVILASATQPALARPMLQTSSLEHTIELIDEPDGLADRLRRVDVDWSRAHAPLSWNALAEELAEEPDVLAIVHRRDDARALTVALDAVLGDETTLHLSALMCPAHRSQVLSEIKERKSRGERLRVVSTQLVEAGVDLDFPVVYRALGGLDALAQAAGRCNREGRLRGRGQLRVFLAPTEPPDGVLLQGLEIARSMLRDELDLFSPATHRAYFERLYRAGSHDEKEVQRKRAELAFEQVAGAYRLIDDSWSAPLVIPFDERTRKDLTELDLAGPSRARLRALQRATVNVRKVELESWKRSGSVRPHGEEIVYALVGDAAYDERFGLVPEQVGSLPPERAVV